MNRKTWICLLILLLPSAVLFGPAIVWDQTFAYRDSARFYHRQFEWNQQQWRNGEIPLWNSQENLGVPVVAEASSSVFYPFQLIFLIPFVKFSTAFVLYAAIHVYLASVGSFFLAREFGCRHATALFAAISYSLSGSLVFQTCNIIFLVGGGWLPFCVWMSYRLFRKPSLVTAGWLGLLMAMPILGGDPQTTYHVGILTGLMYACHFLGRRRNESKHEYRRSLTHHALAATLAFGLSAIQILPSWQATRESTRSYSKSARNVWELLDPSYANSAQGIFGHPTPSTHQDHLYQFSQTPWSLIEFIWPNVTGEVEGRNSRWLEASHTTSRTWTPSAYCGLWTIVLVFSAMFRRSRRWIELWMKIVAIVFLAGALGWYGLGWLIHEFSFICLGLDPASIPIGAPVGGVYWFFVVLLPGYVNFRYPSKLLLIVTLFFCLIAGRELQNILHRKQLPRIRRCLLALCLISLSATMGLWVASMWINQWLQTAAMRSASEFGPFDPSAAWSTLVWSLLQTIGLCIVGLTLVGQTKDRFWLLMGVLLLSFLDLAMANQRLVITARSSLWDRPQTIAEQMDEIEVGSLIRVFRTDPMIWSTKNAWMQKFEANRMEQVVDYEHQTLMSRHHLATTNHRKRIGLVESFRSLEDTRFATLMAFLRGGDGIRTNDSYDLQLSPNPIALGVLGCRYILVPKWGKPDLPEKFETFEIPNQEARVISNPFNPGRFRIVQNIEWIDPVDDLPGWLGDSSNRALVANRSGLSGRFDHALVESQNPIEWSTGNETDPTPSVKIIRESNTAIELEVSGSGFLVMADQYDQDWKAYLQSGDGAEAEVPIYRSELVLRGIPLLRPQGSSAHDRLRIRMVYRPRWVIWGAWISGGTVLLGLVGAMIVYWRRHQRPI